MPSLLNRFIAKSLLPGFLTLTFISCEETKPVLNPDYTGQAGQVTDIEGNIYKTIGIGSQIWMAENLKTRLFNDNSPIPVVLNDSIWSKLQSPGCCWYNNDSLSYKEVYGTLYNFYAVESGLLCPTGWHVPDASDWSTLESCLGGPEIAGGKLKDYYKSYWEEPNPCLLNNYQFYALPGGERLNYTGKFSQISETGFWWTRTLKKDFNAYARTMSHSNKSLGTLLIDTRTGFSVRCIKD
jgi:uncharacterized protein (TIGR02145 family)